MIVDFEKRIQEKTDKELADIYIHAEDYQPEFVSLVEKHLAARKIPLESLNILKEKNDALEDEKLNTGKPGNKFLIVLFFVTCLIGSIIGILAGYHYTFSKQRNSKGEEIYVYNEKTRIYGKFMLAIGGIVLGLSLLSALLANLGIQY
jgi:hypothetical protein